MPIKGGAGVGVHGDEYHTGDVIPAADQDFGGYRLKGLKRVTSVPSAADIGTDGIVLAELAGGGWDQYTKLMLHMNGTDGSTTFTDEIGKMVTAYGNAQIDTAQSKFGGASGLFNGTGDYLYTPDHDDWYFGTGDFTIDSCVRFNAVPSNTWMMFWDQYQDNSNEVFFGLLDDSGTKYWRFIVRVGGSTIIALSKTATVAPNTWYHIALVRSGNSWMLFQDGSQLGTTDTDTDAIPDLAGNVWIGAYRYDSTTYYSLNGWLDEFRVSKGIARWTSNFTPPTQEYAPDAGYVRRLYANVNGTVIGFNADV
jgi:hypothetical protein